MNNRLRTCIVLAAAVMFSALTARPALCQPQPDVLTLIDQGVRYEVESKFDQAIEVYRKVIEIDSTNAFAKIHLAKLLSWMNQFDEALTILDEVIVRDPDQLEALFRKAQILSWQGKYGESIETFEAYLAHRPDDDLGLMAIARVYFWSGSFPEAIEYFDRAIEAGADRKEVYLELGKVYLAMDDKERAREEFNKVLEIDPGNGEAKRFLKGIPKLKVIHASIAGILIDVYPDMSTGLTFTSYITHHHKQTWDFTYLIEDTVINDVRDATLSLTYVYMGIRGLYLLSNLTAYPNPDFSPSYGGELGANYTFRNGFGFGLAFFTERYDEAPLGSIHNDTLFAVKPEVVKYFGDLSNVILRYNQYIFTSGYVTGTVNLSMSVAYFRDNVVYAGITYGGDIETQNADRRVFEFGVGLSYNFTESLGIALNFNRIETQFGQTYQFGLTPLFQW